MQASNLFKVGDRVVTKHGSVATIKSVDVVPADFLEGTYYWPSMSMYTLEMPDGSEMLIDFVDAHSTSGGYLKASLPGTWRLAKH